MPTRLIRDSVCTSKNLNNLTPQAEVLFYRLIVSCDDFGVFYADPSILRAKCFPRKIDIIKDNDILQWLIELVKNELILLFKPNGDCYIQLMTWSSHQNVRAKKSKFPSANSNYMSETDALQYLSNNCIQMLANDNNGIQVQTNDVDNNCIQMLANAPVIQSNPIQSESKSNPSKDDVFVFYEDNFGLITKYIGEILTDAEKEYSKEWLLDALKETRKAGTKNLTYTTKILENWKNNGRNNGHKPATTNQGNSNRQPTEEEYRRSIESTP